ncbi:MAG: sigma-70 family RNA polymerase sigma factor [Synechococcus sp.]
MPVAYPDSFSGYLKEIGRYPLLTPSQEIELSRQAQRYIELRDTEGKPETPQEHRQYRVGKRAFDKMMTSNLRLVVNIAKKFVGRAGHTYGIMDLIQEGCIGLHRAVELFDSSRGYKFSTYSYWWIRQAICRGIDTSDRTIRIPIHALEKLNRLLKLRETYRKENPGEELTLRQAAEMMDVSQDQLALVLERSIHMCSLDVTATTRDGDGAPLIDLIASKESDEDGSYLSNAERIDAISSAIKFLDAEDAEIIVRYFGLNDATEETLSAIGKSKGVCRERIRQKRDRAMRRLSRYLGPALR